VKAFPLHRALTAAAVVIILGLAVWRYFAIPAPIKPYDGKTHLLTLETSGFSRDAPYGRQVEVKLHGVAGTLYYAGGQDYQPGDILDGAFRITVGYRQGSHYKATTSFDIAVKENVRRLRYQPVIWAEIIKTRIAALYSGDSAAMLTGILTGDKHLFSDDLTEVLFRSGMMHVAAVSGLHISILAGFITLIIRSRKRSFIISLPMIFLYMAITGFTPSAVRAGIMIAVFTVAPLIGREYHSRRALTAAFLTLLLLNPYAVFEPAMQLSFSASLGLILFSVKWQKALQDKLSKLPLPKRVLRFIASSLAASFGALVFSMPFAAYWFGGVSLLAPLSNLLLLWLVSVIFIGGALSLVLPFIAPLTAAVLWVFRAVTGLLGGVPHAVLYTSQPFLLVWLLYAYVMFVIMILTGRRKQPVLFTASMLVLCILMTVWRGGRTELEIAVLDVGQGQCVVVRSGGQTAVIDCGGSVNAGRAAARFLDSRGTSRIDHLLLTHYDSDHINGVPSLLSLTDVAAVYGPDEEDIPPLGPVITVRQTETVTLGKTEITMIPSLWFGDANARGLSFLITHQGFSFLITGDLGHPSERWLLRSAGIKNADVIIAGHHGSRGSTSAELLDTLKPQAAVISSGTNSFGHPSPETLSRLLERDIAVYRTDSFGHILIRR
jgi:competence protein ComEC